MSHNPHVYTNMWLAIGGLGNPYDWGTNVMNARDNANVYPLLTKHQVRIITVDGVPGVDRDDFIRALKERGLHDWYMSEERIGTQGPAGMYPWDAEAYLEKRPIDD